MSRHLPVRPNLEYLRKQAKELLQEQRQQNPSAKLADAQHAVAVEYGFPNWSTLKADVGGLARQIPLAGMWHVDPSRSSRQFDTPFQRATLEFAVVDDVVTITDTVVDGSGHEERGTNTIRADGRAHASEHGYVLTASWRGPYVLETVVTKDGGEVSRLTYDVSRDGRTLTVSGTATAHNGYPAVQRVTIFTRVLRGSETQ